MIICYFEWRFNSLDVFVRFYLRSLGSFVYTALSLRQLNPQRISLKVIKLNLIF